MSANVERGVVRAITPYLVVKDGAAAIEFYAKAFGAVENYRLPGPDGASVMHAELSIGEASVYLAGMSGGMDVAWPREDQWPALVLHLSVDDADVAFKRAVDAGCRVMMPLANMFWGDRYGKLADPFGHHWSIAQRLEDVSPEEMAKRAAAQVGQK